MWEMAYASHCAAPMHMPVAKLVPCSTLIATYLCCNCTHCSCLDRKRRCSCSLSFSHCVIGHHSSSAQPAGLLAYPRTSILTLCKLSDETVAHRFIPNCISWQPENQSSRVVTKNPIGAAHAPAATACTTASKSFPHSFATSGDKILHARYVTT